MIATALMIPLSFLTMSLPFASRAIDLLLLVGDLEAEL